MGRKYNRFRSRQEGREEVITTSSQVCRTSNIPLSSNRPRRSAHFLAWRRLCPSLRFAALVIHFSSHAPPSPTTKGQNCRGLVKRSCLIHSSLITLEIRPTNQSPIIIIINLILDNPLHTLGRRLSLAPTILPIHPSSDAGEVVVLGLRSVSFNLTLARSRSFSGALLGRSSAGRFGRSGGRGRDAVAVFFVGFSDLGKVLRDCFLGGFVAEVGGWGNVSCL